MIDLQEDSVTILAVDDDVIVGELIRKALQGLGYRVLVATDGAKGLAVYRQNQAEIALVLLDMIMPNLSGAEVFRTLQRWNPQIKCLMISGYSKSPEVEALLAEGLSGYIQKPFLLHTLTERVEAALASDISIAWGQ